MYREKRGMETIKKTVNSESANSETVNREDSLYSELNAHKEKKIGAPSWQKLGAFLGNKVQL